MFTGLSESLTLTLVILLVFGSACLYLYTRITQTEQKISLIESILLDLKMASDLRHVNTNAPDEDDDNTEEVDEMNWKQGRDTATFHRNTDTRPMTPHAVDDDFSDVLQSAHSSNDNMPPVNFENTASNATRSLKSDLRKSEDSSTDTAAAVPAVTVSVVPASSSSVEPNVVLAAADLTHESSLTNNGTTSEELPFESLDSSMNFSSSGQQPNLESLTAKELHSLAKQRGVSGESKMTRAQLIETLRSVN